MVGKNILFNIFLISPDKLTFMWRSTYLINKELLGNVNRELTKILKIPLSSCLKLCSAHSHFAEFLSLGFSVSVLIKIISGCRSAATANACGISVRNLFMREGWNRSHNKDRVSWELAGFSRGVCQWCATRIYGTSASQSTLYWLN